MEIDKVRDEIKDAKIIAVVRASGVGLVRELAQAYVDGGIRVIELTTSIPNWKVALEEVVDDVGGDALIGLGTVTSAFDAADAIRIGARFIVTPYVAPEVIEQVATHTSVPVIPGALTPSEIAQAYELGADMVKVFPVSSAGGPGHIKAVLAPMPLWELIPTGGVTPENAIEYFNAGAVAVGLGANLVPKIYVENRDWDSAENHIRKFIETLHTQLKEHDKL